MIWLSRTQQLWKLYVSGGIALLAFGTYFLPDLPGIGDMISIWLMILLAAIIPLWMTLTVRCPSCGQRSIPYLYGRVKFTHIVEEFLGLQSCPKCGSHGEGPS